jgi:hypothetical protein
MIRVRSVVAAGASLLVLAAMAPLTSFAQDSAAQPASTQAPAAEDAAPPSALPAAEPIPAAQPGAQQIPSEQNAPPAPTYTSAQLGQILAPVALYPDTLLTNILMASTYPLQVVEAERWLEDPHNAALKGDAIVSALEPMPWDPSVKSIVPFPQIVKQMNDQLDWTQSLGTAVANQQSDVMEQVQLLRHQSESCGKLKSTPQQVVRHDGPAVVIEPANPQVVYVPVYNPAVVYGAWAYPAYPPFYFAPAPGFFVGPVGIDIGFSVGFGIVGPFWGWGGPVWGTHSIFINGGGFSRISFNHVGFAGSSWHHVGPVGRVGGAAFHGPGADRGFAGAGRGGAGGRGFAHAGGAGRAGAGRSGFSHAASRGAGRGGGAHGAAGSHGFSHAGAASHSAGGRSGGGGYHGGGGAFHGGGGGGHFASHASAGHFGGGGGHAVSHGGGRGGGGGHRH